MRDLGLLPTSNRGLPSGVSEPLGIRSSSLEMTPALTNPWLPSEEMIPAPEPCSQAVPKVLSHRNYEMINVYCFKLQSLGVICYTAVDNK